MIRFSFGGRFVLLPGMEKIFFEGEEHRMETLAFDRAFAFVLWGRRQPPPQEGVCPSTQSL